MIPPNNPMFRAADGRFTQAGMDLDNAAIAAMKGFFEQGLPHEVAGILHAAVEELRAETVLVADWTKPKKEKEPDDG